ncbi:hypothetical protein BJ165DRAFT_1530816 [Panaeolus papilionaceus]|nr:hypothetical protein BJ165DRAFT_1530816 [Panaeolus papilionaceus]
MLSHTSPQNLPSATSVHEEYPPKFRVPLNSFLTKVEHRSPISDRRMGTPLRPSVGIRLIKWIMLLIIGIINVCHFWSGACDLIQVVCTSSVRNTLPPLNELCQTDIAQRVLASDTLQKHSTLLHSLSQRVDTISAQLGTVHSILGLDLDPNPDFSLSGHGARILPQFTTQVANSSSLGIINSDFQDHGAEHVRLPIVVLEDINVIGDCWEFDGHRGTVGIKLSEPATITALTVSHIPFNRLSPTSRRRIPKSLVLWGLLRDHDVARQLCYQDNSYCRLVKDMTRTPSAVLPLNLQATDTFVPLINLEFTPSVNKERQSFSAPLPLVALQAVYDVVLVEILSNWGGNTTCLYHLGVNGLSSMP